MRVIGADVSHWESRVDWATAAPTLGFAYYKATEGTTFIDDQFANNKAGCDAVGLPHAPYHYLVPDRDMEEQAWHFIATVGYGYNRYIADCEAPGLTAVKIKSFLDRCEGITRIRPAIYTSPGYWNSLSPRPTWSNQYDLIVAHYTGARNPTKPAGWTTWRIWQNTDYFFFPGCAEVADGNWFNGTMDQCRSWFGNYHQVTPPVPSEGVKYRVLVGQLNVRSGPSTDNAIIGSLRLGDIVDLLETSGEDVWLRHATGWSAVKIDDVRFMEVV